MFCSFANTTKIKSTDAKIHGESCKAYRMKLSPLEQKILMNIQLGVIMVNCSTPGYIFGAFMNSHITTIFTTTLSTNLSSDHQDY